MCFDWLAHTSFCYFYVLCSKLMPRENIIPSKALEKNAIQWVLIEHLLFAQHWHQALGWTEQDAKCGGGCGAMASLTHCWCKPHEERLQLHPENLHRALRQVVARVEPPEHNTADRHTHTPETRSLRWGWYSYCSWKGLQKLIEYNFFILEMKSVSNIERMGTMITFIHYWKERFFQLLFFLTQPLWKTVWLCKVMPTVEFHVT